jgi:hypothetical protein
MQQRVLTRNNMNNIFVFGSNLAGRHGAGAALFALQNHGAIYGQGIGMQGDSYAIPTKDFLIKTLPLQIIKWHVNVFLEFATQQNILTFNVTRIGCGLAGYKDSDIAPMFKGAPINCLLPEGWREINGHGIPRDDASHRSPRDERGELQPQAHRHQDTCCD